MKILLTGSAGQLGQALRQQVPEGIELIATSWSGDSATGLLPLDLADAAACHAAVLEHRPDWVLNGGAYTAVDKGDAMSDFMPTAAELLAGRQRILVTGGAGFIGGAMVRRRLYWRCDGAAPTEGERGAGVQPRQDGVRQRPQQH